MRKRITFFITFLAIMANAHAMTRDAKLTDTTGYNYNYMYPYMNNQMRTNLNPGVTTSQSTNPINTVVKTIPLSSPRRVVPRPTNTARGATNTTARRAISANSARAGTRTAPVRATNTNRRVVARSGLRPTATMRTSSRGDASYTGRTAANAANYATTDTNRVSSARCLTDYTECMNGYCEREKTKYNRCYCSSKLSQIDAQYQSTIESLIVQILTIKSENNWSDTEMNEYWMNTIGKYTGGENSWTNMDNALDINWADMESRVRGQGAFNTGHEFCIQHLRGCSYMASNLRDAYRSEIARDCATYEESLQRLKSAAESIIEAYK